MQRAVHYGVSPATLSQRGGSVLTNEKPGDVFDAIVFQRTG
jgi:hypothetical protein